MNHNSLGWEQPLVLHICDTVTQYAGCIRGNTRPHHGVTTSVCVNIVCVYMYIQSLRQGKARQLRLKTTPLFPKRKRRAASGGTRIHTCMLHSFTHVHVILSNTYIMYMYTLWILPYLPAILYASVCIVVLAVLWGLGTLVWRFLKDRRCAHYLHVKRVDRVTARVSWHGHVHIPYSGYFWGVKFS